VLSRPLRLPRADGTLTMAGVSKQPESRTKSGKKHAGKNKGNEQSRQSGTHNALPVSAEGLTAPTSRRVNIALPFSQIRTQEPSQEVADLADLVADLLAALGDVFGSEAFDELEARADALRQRLR